MKRFIPSIVLVIIFSSYAKAGSVYDYVAARKNCKIAMNMPQAYINKYQDLFKDIFNQKGYSSNFIMVEFKNFPLEQEFFMTIGYIKEGFVKTTVTTSQKEKLEDSFDPVFFNEVTAVTTKGSLAKALESMPRCVPTW